MHSSDCLKILIISMLSQDITSYKTVYSDKSRLIKTYNQFFSRLPGLDIA